MSSQNNQNSENQHPSESANLISQRAQYSDLFNRLNDCVWLLDTTSFKILEANFFCEQTFKQSATDFLGKPIFEWVEKSQHAELNKSLRIAKRKYYPTTLLHKFLGPDSKVIDMELAVCPLRISEDLEVIQMIGRDVTFKLAAEKQIQELVGELKQANTRLELLSTTDEMTGLFNFRNFKTLLAAEHTRCARYGSPYSIVFIDLDHFKKYNDRNGHPAGDRLLKGFAEILKKCCRTSDIPARYGGEEFAVICVSSSSQGALVLAERIRSSVESTEFEFSKFQPAGKQTVSIGVSSFPEDGDTAEKVLKAADEGVYHSKENGRNQVTLASSTKKPKTA